MELLEKWINKNYSKKRKILKAEVLQRSLYVFKFFLLFEWTRINKNYSKKRKILKEGVQWSHIWIIQWKRLAAISIYPVKKNPLSLREGILKIGIDLLLRALGQLPSAQPGLTTLFGMGRGGPRRYRHHKLLSIE